MNNSQQLSVIEQVMLQGNLKSLSPQQKIEYYAKTCESLGLNPLTKPFEYIVLNGKEVLYATKGCTEQLRNIHGVSIRIVDKQKIDDIYIVTAEASDKVGRVDSATGAVTIAGLKGDSLANAIMKAETKAKRRVTLSLCGLNMLDELEVETVSGARQVSQPRVVSEPVVISSPVATQSQPEHPSHFDETPPASSEWDSFGPDLKREEEFDPDFVVSFGKYKGQTLEQVGIDNVSSYASFLIGKLNEANKEAEGAVADFLKQANAFSALVRGK